MTSEERREARYQRRKAKRDEARLRRSKECGDFDEVFSFRHLYLSGKKCCKGVYWKNSTQRYIGNIIPIIAKTHRELQNGTFKHRGFHAFTIMERGKKRYIRSVHITERAVQKCLCDYCLVPIYSACFIYDNSASLKHRGMDFALRRMTCYLQRHYRKYGLEGGVLLYDFHSFFDSAPHEPLFREADRRLHDPKIRELANSFITDFGSVGLGLGSQVSQTNALMLPNMIDHYFKEVCRIKAYERYMDDGVAISPDIDDLYLCMDGLKIICEKCGLELNLRKTRVVPLRDYYRWLKTRFIITPTGKVVRKMNKDSTKIVRHKLRAFRGKLDRGEMTLADIRCSVDSYNGHMKRGHSFKVRQRTNQYFKSLYGFYPDEKGWKAMYKIIKKDAVLGIVSNLTWVCMQENGCYGLTVEDNAQGIALNGTVYHVNGHPELDGAETVSVEEVDDGVYASSLTALLTDPNDIRNSEQFRKAVQMFAKSLDEDSAMVVATIYDPYQVGHAYAVGDYFTYGVNGVGDPQLYKVVQAHTSQADWKPDTLPALYTPIGLTPSGYPVWTQPTGAHDAYNKGDIVSYNDKLYRSLIDGNVYSPDAYPAGWEEYTGK